MIDLHSHLLPEHLPEFGPGFPLLHGAGSRREIRVDGHFFRAVERSAWDLDYRIEHYRSHGVSIQVVSTVPVLFSYHLPAAPAARLARWLNEHLAEQQRRYPGQVLALGSLPLQDTRLAIAEAEHLAGELKLPGVQIGSNINQRNLDDPELFEVFSALSDLGLAVLVHPWDMLGREHLNDYWLPWLVGMPAEQARAICCMIFGGVLERLPDLRVCFAHGGGAFAFTLGRIEHGFHMRPDLVAHRNPISPRDYLRRFWVDSVTHDLKALRYLIDLHGEEHVTMGTDYPFPLGEQQPGGLIARLDLDAAGQQRLLWRNALDFLGLRPEALDLPA